MKKLILPLLLMAAPAGAAPVGMAAHVTGAVTFERDGKSAPLRPLQRLEPGDAVRAAAGASAVVVLFGDGSRYSVPGGARATVGNGAVQGAQKMAGFSGPAAGVVATLGGARVGAAISRQTNSFQRLLPNAPGWLESDHPSFQWLPISGAASYTFTLFDVHDNVVFSMRTGPATTTAQYPAELPALAEKRAYLWKVAAFSASGKPVPESRWGLVTVLSPTDARALEKSAQTLQDQAKTAPDTTPLLLLAELYRSYGVLNRTLEVLEDERLRAEPDTAAAKQGVIAELSPFVRALAE